MNAPPRNPAVNAHHGSVRARSVTTILPSDRRIVGEAMTMTLMRARPIAKEMSAARTPLPECLVSSPFARAWSEDAKPPKDRMSANAPKDRRRARGLLNGVADTPEP